MSTNEYTPEVWSGPVLENLKASILTTSNIAAYGRKHHVVRTPYTAEELDARDKAISEWRTLTNTLIEQGWLDNAPCYECAGELEPTTATEHTEYVYDETINEYHARLREINGGNETVAFSITES